MMGKASKTRARQRAAVAARRETVRARRDELRPLWPAVSTGLACDSGVQVRLASPEDEASIRAYLLQATEDEGVNDPAKPVPTVCPTIRAGLEGGKDGFMQGLANQLTALSTNHAHESTVMVGFSLVAVDEMGAVVGSITVAPPYTYMQNVVDGIADDHEARQMLVSAQLGLSKITGVAVREDMRGRGIGADLVRTALQVLRRCGIGMIVFGSCEPPRAAFYRRLGFNISPLDAPIDLWPALGIHALISTPDHHIFSMQRELR